MIKYVIIIMVLFALGSCETNYGTINTGLADGKFNGNMYEYFQANHYDWDSLVLMIDRAGLKDVFTGERAGFEKITFFGPTNHTIRLWMYKSERRWDPELMQTVVVKSLLSGRRDSGGGLSSAGYGACREGCLYAG